MARKYEVSFQGSQGQVAKVLAIRDNVTTVKFAKRRTNKRLPGPGHFGGALVKPNK